LLEKIAKDGRLIGNTSALLTRQQVDEDRSKKHIKRRKYNADYCYSQGRHGGLKRRRRSRGLNFGDLDFGGGGGGLGGL